MSNNVKYGTYPINKYIVKMEKAHARYLVSLAYNQADETGTLPERDLDYAVLIYDLGQFLTASFTGWYREAAAIDVSYRNEKIAVGWLLRLRGQVRLADFYPLSSNILEVPFGKETKLLGQTRKTLPRSVFDHLQQSPWGVVSE